MVSAASTHLSNASVEMLGALMLLLVTVACEVLPVVVGDVNRAWYVSLASVISLVCLKDEDFYPPDGTHHITAVLWAIGAYETNTEVFFRLVGQTMGVLVGWLVVTQLDLSHAHRYEDTQRANVGVICTVEAFGTLLECVTFVYLLVPLLTISVKQANGNSMWLLKPKADMDTHTPSTERLLCVAIVLVLLHWMLFSVFGVDLQPTVTLVLAVMRGDNWDVALGRILSQWVGATVAALYARFYVQRYRERISRTSTVTPRSVKPNVFMGISRPNSTSS